jgi:outer membrane protein assembly factor BamE (lipoprotein component of BamABCDE complex)
VDLKQGMSAEEVQRLLGKPRRTALKSGSTSTQGTLQWTYLWAGASSSQGILQVEFAAKAPQAWYVDSWEWRSY